MFGFLKKKEKKAKEKPTKKNKAQKNLYVPRCGTLEEFLSTYKTGEEHLTLGRVNGHGLSVTGLVPPADSILIINDNSDDVRKDMLAGIIGQGKLSYVVYDPEGKYCDSLSQRMKSKCYDVQVIDLNDESHSSRIDLFEIANITKNPYWTAVMLSASIGCTENEIIPAHDLLMALMEYDLSMHGTITIESICNSFVKLYKKDEKIIDDLSRTKRAYPHLAKFDENNANIKDSVYKKIYAHLLKDLANKIRKPNIFSVTSHQKQTITFIKSVPSKYKNLIAAFLFNLKSSGVIRENIDVSTAIIDTSADDWYNRDLLKRMCAEISDELDKSTIMIETEPELRRSDFDKRQLIVYMHSASNDTKTMMEDALKVKNLGPAILTQIEQERDGKALSEEEMELMPIDKSVLDKNEDCILIDTTKKIRPIQFNRW